MNNKSEKDHDFCFNSLLVFFFVCVCSEMARCHCSFRRILICLCTLCGTFVLLFIYVGIVVCMSMNGTPTPLAIIRVNPLIVATGSETFWQRPSREAYWNSLQEAVDFHFNPVLNSKDPSIVFHDSIFYEFVRKRSFTKVSATAEKLDTSQYPPLLQDFVNNMERRDYPVLIQPGGLCGAGAKDENEPPLILLAIKSSELNFKNRQAIRNTWGRAGWVPGQSDRGGERRGGGYVRRIFLLGKENFEDLGVNTTSLLRTENELYGDILQWDFKDTFFNLTLKDVLFWEWFSHHCGSTKFIFKGDDDVFVNTHRMLTYLQEQLQKPGAEETMKDFMVGYLLGSVEPIRDVYSKYFIPDTFYKGLYPTYESGGGVIYTGQLTKRLYEISQRVHLFPIDDTFVGMCMSRLNAMPSHHPAFLIYDFNAKEAEAECSHHTVLLLHKRSPAQLMSLWNNMKMTEEKCWNATLR